MSVAPILMLQVLRRLLTAWHFLHRAALDSESEKLVVRSLQKAMQRTKCMVMVTHRLGIIRSLDVNRVLVLDKGKVVEEGHPEDLLKQKDGLYAALAREQGITSRSNETFSRIEEKI